MVDDPYFNECPKEMFLCWLQVKFYCVVEDASVVVIDWHVLLVIQPILATEST